MYERGIPSHLGGLEGADHDADWLPLSLENQPT